MKLSRREFLAASAMVGVGILIAGYLYPFSKKWRSTTPRIDEIPSVTEVGESKVYVVKTSDRREAVRRLMNEFDLTDYKGKTVALKANFNSADPPPASTHLDTLESIVKVLKDEGMAEMTLAERSGMGNTMGVLETLGVNDLGNRLGFSVVSLDDVGADSWTKVEADWLNWKDGFYIANIFLEADKVVQTCCLKTHRFGGHFTMALKNSVGLIAKRVPRQVHDYMRELHGSSHQREMIAEINRFYEVDMVIMDAVSGFKNRGPDVGHLIEPNLLLASKDRVALDAVGVAILRSYGTTNDVMRGKIFEQDQIQRAAEIGVGVGSAEKISLIPLNDEAEDPVEVLKQILLN